MSKAELLQQLSRLSREDLDDVADRVDLLRGGDMTATERALIRERLTEYRKSPHELVDLDDAVRDILADQK